MLCQTVTNMTTTIAQNIVKDKQSRLSDVFWIFRGCLSEVWGTVSSVASFNEIYLKIENKFEYISFKIKFIWIESELIRVTQSHPFTTDNPQTPAKPSNVEFI